MAHKIVLTDLVSGEVVVDELPVTKFKYGDTLNSSAAAVLDISRTSNRINSTNVTTANRGVWILDDNGVVQWSGIYWNNQQNGDIIKMHCSTPLSYLTRRRVTFTQAYDNIDQINVVSDFLTQLMAGQTGDLEWGINTQSTHVVNRSLKFYAHEKRQASTVLGELGNSRDGFDFAILPDPNPINSTRPFRNNFHVWHPKRGRILRDLVWTVSPPGDPNTMCEIKSYTETGSSRVNRLYGIGAGNGYEGVNVTAYPNDDPNHSGYPLLEGVTQYKAIKNPAYLQQLTDRDTEALENPRTLVLKVPDTRAAQLGTFGVGDYVSLQINDGWQNIQGNWRIHSYEYNVSVEKVEATVTLKDW